MFHNKQSKMKQNFWVDMPTLHNPKKTRKTPDIMAV